MKCKTCRIKEREGKNDICSSCRLKNWRKDNPDKIKAYLDRTKDHRDEVRKRYIEKTSEERKKYYNAYYDKNREARIKKTNEIQKAKGHPCEKAPERKKRAAIRGQTRRKYPLKGNTCKFCSNKAAQHHHTTEPITVDDFIFTCKKHHDHTHGKRCVLVLEGEHGN